jgi:Jumonji helical domain
MATGMIANPSFRRSAKCGRFNSMLEGKQLQNFPAEKFNSQTLTQLWLDTDGFERPVIIENMAGLGMKLPDSSSKLSDIASIIGPNFPIKVIGVGEQSEISANIGDYAHYIANRTADHKVLNLISLEVSATRLSGKVQSPSLVREVDWIDKCWPLDRRARGDFPQVQKYCLCGMAGSYTDFHVDFGGTSVWYHVLSGQKRFYLVAPTTANLRAFEHWTCSKNQDTVFFGDVVGHDNCFQLDLLAGQTLLIPGAWIHAVHTPLDSLVFGGNFLNSFNIIRQLQVYGIEQRTFVGKAYRFPHFKLVNWFLLCTLLPLAKKLVNPLTESKKSGDASDSDDDNEDLMSLCNSIKAPSVFRQFPFLVRTCQFWLEALDDEEHTDFLKAAQEAWCDGCQSVIDSWWEILLSLADILGAGEADKFERTKLRKHVERVRVIKIFDLLNDNFVSSAFADVPCKPFDEEVVEHITSVSMPAVGGGIKDKVIEGVGVYEEKDFKEEAKQLLRIKLKLSKRDIVNSVTQEDDGHLSDVGETASLEEKEELKAEEESGLRFRFQMPSMLPKTARQPYEANDVDVADGSSTRFNITISSSSSGSSSQSLDLRKRMAMQSERMKGVRTGQSSGLILSAKKGNAVVSKAAAKRKVRRVEEYEYQEDIQRPAPVSHEFDTANILPERQGGRYGTRGKRVSAAFLLHAEDVDIREMRVDPSSDNEDEDVDPAEVKKVPEGSEAGDDDIPFMFDDDAGLPYGEEEWVAGKSDGEDRDEERGGPEDEEDEESDMGSEVGSDAEDYGAGAGRKRTREPVAATRAPASSSAKLYDKPKRAAKVVTNRQRLIAKFR